MTNLKTSILNGLERLPLIKEIAAHRDELRSLVIQQQSELENLRQDLAALQRSAGFVPPGHFYSPIPSLDEVKAQEAKLFGNCPAVIPGIDLRESEQLALLGELAEFYGEMPFQPTRQAHLRYYFENPAYSYSDAICLYSMIRRVKPGKIMEIGSGFSSCVMLDTNELFFQGNISTTFIEPYPELLYSLVKEEDKPSLRVIPKKLQEVDVAEFDALQANDILFIDSTHVSKINSDVNTIFFELFPRLPSGCYVHIHDIFYPFEYPKEWLYEGKAWNEAYMLRAFLQYNREFPIILMNTYLEHFHESFFQEYMPLCLVNRGGSIWLRKN